MINDRVSVEHLKPILKPTTMMVDNYVFILTKIILNISSHNNILYLWNNKKKKCVQCIKDLNN